MKPGDLVVTETGTAQFGFNVTELPAGVHSWTQAVWGSIGYAIGAAVGGSVAAKELGQYRRMIVFTGEGSLQLTVQASSLLLRHGIVPIVYATSALHAPLSLLTGESGLFSTTKGTNA